MVAYVSLLGSFEHHAIVGIFVTKTGCEGVQLPHSAKVEDAIGALKHTRQLPSLKVYSIKSVESSQAKK